MDIRLFSQAKIFAKAFFNTYYQGDNIKSFPVQSMIKLQDFFYQHPVAISLLACSLLSGSCDKALCNFVYKLGGGQVEADFFCYVLHKKNVRILRFLPAALKTEFFARQGIVPCLIETSHALNSDQQQLLADVFEQAIARVQNSVIVQPEFRACSDLGLGVRMRCGDWFYENSLKRRWKKVLVALDTGV